MKGIIKIGRVASIGLFVIGAILYLFFSTCSPLLHNHSGCEYSNHCCDTHSDSNRHHPDCPACNFLFVAAFFDIPEIVIVPTISYHVAFGTFFDYQQPYQQLCYDCHSIRGPPIISV
ncbi:hypothetical protein KKC91_00010 [bacterium]|nr:hypothetical protein [bacterium]